ncbi:hypothetical protein BB560_006665 [Smittium megazygosporum]|uniref:Hypervirulence associated protein TUDOR domain-containing protein n=1 Tax=Smittium megazygosporum TaxID=133381 RepID=A0A2T9Y2I6_9FUNG|nr:hypothetical protein BB560_006665 [Smittium megazygosporum]
MRAFNRALMIASAVLAVLALTSVEAGKAAEKFGKAGGDKEIRWGRPSDRSGETGEHTRIHMTRSGEPGDHTRIHMTRSGEPGDHTRIHMTRSGEPGEHTRHHWDNSANSENPESAN